MEENLIKEQKKEPKVLWIFRTNLREMEYYHVFKEMNEFKTHCHDFYLLMGLWYIENDFFDEVVVWRLKPRKQAVQNITFRVRDKIFTQLFTNSFYTAFDLPVPTVSLFRGGFPEYCAITRRVPSHFGISMYLGAGRRVFPEYGGKYIKVLVESDEDLELHPITEPFFKTANSKIFHPVRSSSLKYDLCWICNFTQINYKGQEYFIEQISKSKYLKALSIVHIGNEPDQGLELCKKYGVTNIDFRGYLPRSEINLFLNQSKVAVVTSNENDGSPRVVTEILCSCTPLLVRKSTRLLSFYKERGVVVFDDDELEEKTAYAIDNRERLKEELLQNLNNISLGQICNLNYRIWFRPPKKISSYLYTSR